LHHLVSESLQPRIVLLEAAAIRSYLRFTKAGLHLSRASAV